MVSKAPFEFDLRVSTDKRRKSVTRRGTVAAEASGRTCDYPECEKAALHRAPKGRELLDEYFWFCPEHIREYNLAWNFFDGTTDEEFKKLMDGARTWERGTKPFSRLGDGNAWARMGVNDPHQILGDNATINKGREPAGGATRKLPSTERKALEILDSKDTMTKSEIRKQYKALIKILHPDMNGGDRSDEERLQEVVWAWDQIKESKFFKD